MKNADVMRLKPTLWRTCRVLANRRRLQILEHLITHGPRTVKQVAEQLQWPETTATINLRALNSRGMLQTRRFGKFVLYSVGADPTIPEAKALLMVVKRALATRHDAIDVLIRHFTAFTHPRRILIVSTLGRRTLAFNELQERTAISRQAMGRHIEKLVERGYMVQKENSCRCVRGRHVIEKTLLDLAQRK